MTRNDAIDRAVRSVLPKYMFTWTAFPATRSWIDAVNLACLSAADVKAIRREFRNLCLENTICG